MDGTAAGAAFERRCRRMVREQILGRGIDHPPLLEAFLATPRHLFVDEALSERAYSDGSLPIGWGQTISQPYIVARMLHLLGVRPGDKVLEIGTGSGYQAALLAHLTGAAWTVERLEPLARRARDNWLRAGVRHVNLRLGDGTLGWPSEAPFAAIIVGAAAPAPPKSLLAQVAPGGRLVVPIGDAVRQVVKVLKRTGTGAQVEDGDACSFVRLIGREGFGE
ncbi:MAG TPA: protein-L-isoaspartate(D-aspartate) O-methyltransferase [Candidatus Polarisedimenticolia bacterium]|nr:protein-L-isoaspartate(D-aspartate) O-methyltransferase [Candidatus Polarisedimenticolia bacterium]